MYEHTPPAPPPKPPGTHDVSRMSTPTSGPVPRPPPLPEAVAAGLGDSGHQPPGAEEHHGLGSHEDIADPGDQWLPKFLQDKSKQDLADILSDGALLSALTHAPQTAHTSVRASHDALRRALSDNAELAAQLLDLEARVAAQRSAAQAQLLAARALERQWRAKQGEMDHALAPFAPASLYQRLAQGVAEQEGVCCALEESFLEAQGDGGPATEREVGDWVRRYREAKKLYYLRQERKERWDEGRVGGWR
ncbi:hypothetical protein C7999DRAFT_38238 [Corynascus novoguineensis]|uniref:VPS37 C-terminal domain-containing protein n=1 Tax=Corynascus novoguineensis TaxID=1126955 RepID=A0AAN7CYT7_9PEZI|nr:hypothetical protein C7999DRAFT_38238 [Corynascus novoguineensis]